LPNACIHRLARDLYRLEQKADLVGGHATITVAFAP
jgi:hypothetical protein